VGGARLIPEHPASDRVARRFRSERVSEAPLSEDSNHFAAAPRAWVSLAKVPDEVEQRLGIPAAKAAEILRPLLEESFFSTIVVGWDDSRGPQDWVLRFSHDHRNPYGVSRLGWGHLDWRKGQLAGCEVLVYWTGVVERLAGSTTTFRFTSAEPKAAAALDAKAEAAHNWMNGYVLGYNHAGEKPKRDETLKLCRDGTGATYKEALAAWDAQPAKLKRHPRTRRDV
jgi:hypothetical protein